MNKYIYIYILTIPKTFDDFDVISVIMFCPG